MRVVIAGGPRTGKTTFSERMRTHMEAERDGRSVLTHHTDSLIGKLDWSQVSEHVAKVWMQTSGPWIIEGVSAVRALRKALKYNPLDAPCDALYMLGTPFVTLTPMQLKMSSDIWNHFHEIQAELVRRGVKIIRRDS